MDGSISKSGLDCNEQETHIGEHQSLGGQVVPLNSECPILQDPREKRPLWLRVFGHEFPLQSGLDRRAPACLPEFETLTQ